jgi:hypothetical protein
MINRDDTLIYIKEYNSSLLVFFYKVDITNPTPLNRNLALEICYKKGYNGISL